MNPVGFRTLFAKETRRFLKVPGQTLASPIVTTVRGSYEELAIEFQRLIDNYVERNYARRRLRTTSSRISIGPRRTTISGIVVLDCSSPSA